MMGTVFIFAKAARAGAVKTRLGADIGMGRAAALFRIMTERVVAEASSDAWRTVIAVDPASALGERNKIWPDHCGRIVQGKGNLGDRMARVIRHAPQGPMIIIGADAPQLRRHHIRDAFSVLRGADAVFGPADDGGYWLIGLARRRAAPDLFAHVRWSSEYALEDTRVSLPSSFRVAMLATLHDIDHVSDLRHLGLRSTAGQK